MKSVASHILMSSQDPSVGPQTVGIRADSNRRPRIVKRRKATGALDSNQYNLRARSVRVLTASTTLTPEDDGALIVFNSTTSIIVTLPATEKNVEFEFYVQLATTGGVGHAISPNANDKIFAPGFTAADDKDAINTQATSAIGDAFRVVGDGSVGWYGYIDGGVWARE